MASKTSAKPSAKAVVSNSSQVLKRAPGGTKLSIGATKVTKPKRSKKYAAMLGMTEFTREATEAVKRASTGQREIIFGTSLSKPQIRFRPASLYEDEVDEIPEKNQIKISRLRLFSVTYRALVLIGEKFIVTSGSHKVIMDRHPDYPAKVADEHMRDYRERAVSTSQRVARKYAYRASQGTLKILAYLETISTEQSRRDSEILQFLKEVSEKGILTTEQKASLDLLFKRLEKVRAENNRVPKRSPTEKDLERYEVNN